MNNFDRRQTRYGSIHALSSNGSSPACPERRQLRMSCSGTRRGFADNSANAENSAASSALSVNFSEAYEWSFLCAFSLLSSLEIADDIKD
jgi:hypothetical protein